MSEIPDPSTRRLVETTLAVWPEHERFLRKSFADGFAHLAQVRATIAALLLRIVETRDAALEDWIGDYRYFCERIILPEELYFRRHDRYRLSTFVEADAEVYANSELMARYMNGLLVSDVLWANHAETMRDFSESYLPTLQPAGRHLEIGPGHGMLLHLALQSGRFDELNAWDVSATSLEHTAGVLALVPGGRQVRLRSQNIYDTDAMTGDLGCYSTVVMSEVLEHLERPLEALQIVRRLLAPGGSAWINVPGNSPAIDHLFLVRDRAQLETLLAEAGLKIVQDAIYPMTGATLDKAVRHNLPVSFVVTCRSDHDS